MKQVSSKHCKKRNVGSTLEMLTALKGEIIPWGSGLRCRYRHGWYPQCGDFDSRIG